MKISDILVRDAVILDLAAREKRDVLAEMAKALAKRGEGLHHVCLEVADLVKSMAELKAQGAPLLDEKPRPGAGGTQVAFVHPKGSNGVLVELKQAGSGTH